MLRIPFWQKLTVVFVLILSIVFSLPTVMDKNKLPSWWPGNPINLGLDLQGGAHLVLGVDIEASMKRAYENLEDESREILKDAEPSIAIRGMRSGLESGVHFTVIEPSQVETAITTLRRQIMGVDVMEEADGRLRIRYTEPQMMEMRNHALEQTLEILRLRVDEFGVAEPLIQREGNDRIIIELPGITDVSRAKSVIGRTAELSFHLVQEGVSADELRSGRLPPGTKIFPMIQKSPSGESFEVPIALQRRAMLTGENLANASSGFDQFGQSTVDITFDSRGSDRFARVTTNNVGERMAIVLDGKVYSAPVLREPILGGRAQISGNFTTHEANDLAMVLRAGALPAPVEIVEERTIGPSLGQDSVEAGSLAMIIGFLAVLVTMVLFYTFYGFVANIALFFNVTLIIAIMSLLGATLTLPGIAGIVLTLGMAVDANVLIFERIREESAKGISAIIAMENGFKAAYATIVDANITGLVAAVVMFGMGSGPVKGFALTFGLGIVVSMFTAILLTRMILAGWLLRKRPKNLGL